MVSGLHGSLPLSQNMSPRGGILDRHRTKGDKDASLVPTPREEEQWTPVRWDSRLGAIRPTSERQQLGRVWQGTSHESCPLSGRHHLPLSQGTQGPLFLQGSRTDVILS